jgi:hypothetical protein
MAFARAFRGSTRVAELTLEARAVTTFGRGDTCHICIGDDDTGVSRVAGCIWFEGTEWRIANLSSSRPLRLMNEETCLSVTLAVATPTRKPVFVAQSDLVTVLLDGNAYRYAIALSGLRPEAQAPPITHGPGEVSTVRPFKPTARQREILVALAWGYLQPYPRYDPRPLAYSEAAALVGATGKRVEKHIAEIRRRFVEAGLHGLVDSPDARAEVCERALELHIIGPDDVPWLRERMATRSLAIDED